MKVLVLVIILILFIFSLNSQQIYKYNPIYEEVGGFISNGRTDNLKINENKNILIIDQTYANTGDFLVLSTDKGKNWNKIFESESFEYEIKDIDFPSKKNIIWVGDSTEYQETVGSNAYFKRRGVFFRSMNGGQDWLKTILDSNTYLNHVVMLNDSIGIINKKNTTNLYNQNYISEDTLLYSSDFFNSWEKIILPEPNSIISQIFLLDEKNIIIRTYNSTNKKSKYWETIDKGETWEYLFDALNIYNIHFIDRQNVIKIQREYIEPFGVEYTDIYKSIDGGKNWIKLFTPLDETKYYLPSSVDAYDFDNFAVTGDSHLIFRTTNGGEKWNREYLPNNLSSYELGYGNNHRIRYLDSKEILVMSNEHILISDKSILARPIIYRPKNDPRSNPNKALAHWSSVKGATSYRFQLAPSNDMYYSYDKFNNIIFDTTVVDTFLYCKNLNYDKCYYGRVKANNDISQSEWSIKASLFCTFKTPNTLNSPYFIKPRNLEHIEKNHVEFKWSLVDDGYLYRLQISENSNFSNLFFSQVLVQDSTFEVDGLNTNQIYYARVATVNGEKSSEWNNIRFYITQTSSIKMLNDYEQFSIYPNPANNKLNIVTDEIISNIKIIDLLGRVVYQSDANSKEIDISNLQTGVYNLVVNQEQSLKFIKE